ncbi:hypothetical protein PENSTE_c004G01621 [Penicillium steckii]|uniref:Transcription factor domain-containing protein n=1 Tax=Penicillium steckii TaxID=303698 RepID=A0A1V6TPK5_9EURO|nr:hypothetical protein PENSTE_c004G01621 [Penicillium steckii]
MPVSTVSRPFRLLSDILYQHHEHRNSDSQEEGRCARLGKSCTYLDLPQTRKKHNAAPSRVALLEGQVGQLTSQLSALTRQNDLNRRISPETPIDISNTLTNDSGSSQGQRLESEDISMLLDAAKDPSHGLAPPISSALAGQPSLVDRGLFSESETENLIQTFKSAFVPKFPFVLIASTETAVQLGKREPFLFLCVIAATIGSSHPLRKKVTEEVMKHITLRVVERSERNLELLRGLLVYSAWYTYPAERYHPQLLLLIQFCVSILYDLGLHKKSTASLDEQRALLGTYWLSSSTLGRPTAIKHDSRIDECIENLSSTEYLSDRMIAPFIQLQFFLTTMDDAYTSMQARGGRALVQVIRDSLQRQLDSVRARIEKDLPFFPSPLGNAVRTELHYAEMRLEELSLREQLWTGESNSAFRVNMLMTMIQKGREVIHTIRNLPKSEIAEMTIITSAHICAAVGYIPTAVMSILNNITNVEVPIMDAEVQAVLEAADYPHVVADLANALDTRLVGMSAADREWDITGSLCSKMRLLARCYPYQVKAIVGSTLSKDVGQSMSLVDAAQSSEDSIAPQLWSSTEGNDRIPEDMLPIDEIQWESLLSDFTGFN